MTADERYAAALAASSVMKGLPDVPDGLKPEATLRDRVRLGGDPQGGMSKRMKRALDTAHLKSQNPKEALFLAAYRHAMQQARGLNPSEQRQLLQDNRQQDQDNQSAIVNSAANADQSTNETTVKKHGTRPSK